MDAPGWPQPYHRSRLHYKPGAEYKPHYDYFDPVHPGSASIPHGFNTPQLRDVRNTAPYMHNGVFETLEDVVAFYDANPLTGGPLRLSGPEKADLVAYLKTL